MAIERVTEVDDAVQVKRVLVSVSDKSGLDTLVQGLAETCDPLELYSTGGTFTALESIVAEHDGISLIPVTAYTGQPEMRGGLVKTLDYRIYLGLLSETYNPDHRNDIDRLNAVPFDLTVVNLYPFEQAAAAADGDDEQARGNIDIGGPAMLRASAKNYLRVTAICDPADYPALIAHVAQNGGATRLSFRRRSAAKVFAETAAYDAEIARYMARRSDDEAAHPYTIR